MQLSSSTAFLSRSNWDQRIFFSAHSRVTGRFQKTSFLAPSYEPLLGAPLQHGSPLSPGHTIQEGRHSVFIPSSQIQHPVIYQCLFVRGGSVNLAHTQGENITQGHEYQEVGISRNWLPHLSFQSYNHSMLSTRRNSPQVSRRRRASAQDHRGTEW